MKASDTYGIRVCGESSLYLAGNRGIGSLDGAFIDR